MRIRVGIAEYAVIKGSGILEAIGLGSCIAIALYDPYNSVGGMAHPLLPSINGYRNPRIPSKYLDRALSLVIDEMKSKGAKIENVIAKAAGGATIFKLEHIPNIGQQNINALHEYLNKIGIPLKAVDLGGNYGRSVFFNVETGEFVVRSVKKGTLIL